MAGKGFTAAINLAVGNAIVTRAGPALLVQSITPQAHPEGVPVYNFEVEDDHTYFVGNTNGGTWVHNDCTAALAKIFKEYPVTSFNCDIASVKALKVLEKVYPDAHIIRVHDVSGASFFFTREGVTFSKQGFHELVYANGKFYDALTGPNGATPAAYWQLWDPQHWGRMRLTP